MTDNPAHTLCDSIAQCQAVLDDLKGGSITPEQAIEKMKVELGREGVLRAMHAVGYFPEGSAPPGVVADH